MVKKFVVYKCELSGKEFATQEEAERSEAERRMVDAMQLALRRKYGEDVNFHDDDILLVLSAVREIAQLVMPLLLGQGVLGDVTISIEGAAGSGKTRVAQLLEYAYGSTHDFKHYTETPDTRICKVDLIRKTGDK